MIFNVHSINKISMINNMPSFIYDNGSDFQKSVIPIAVKSASRISSTYYNLKSVPTTPATGSLVEDAPRTTAREKVITSPAPLASRYGVDTVVK